MLFHYLILPAIVILFKEKQTHNTSTLRSALTNYKNKREREREEETHPLIKSCLTHSYRICANCYALLRSPLITAANMVLKLC